MADSKLPEQGSVKAEDGDYSKMIEGDCIQQEGSFGVGNNKGEVSTKNIAGTIYEASVERNIQAGAVNIYEQSILIGSDTANQKTINKQQLAFVLTGTISEVDRTKLRAIQAHLRKISGDAELTIIDVEEGSIKLKLNGSPEGLKKLEELFKSGELTEVLGITVEDVQLLSGDTQKEEKNPTSNNKNFSNLRIEKRIRIAKNGNTVIVLAPVGRLDITSAWQFRLCLQECIFNYSPHMVVNLGQVNFIDSSGLTSLVAGMRDADKAKGCLRICNVRPEAKLVYEVTMMDTVIEMFDTEEEAVDDVFRITRSNLA